MADVEKRIAEMPKPENPYKAGMHLHIVWEQATEEQRKLLAEQGWMKLPSNPELLAPMLRQLVQEHKHACNDPECPIMVSLVGQLYKCLVERDLTTEERAIFI